MNKIKSLNVKMIKKTKSLAKDISSLDFHFDCNFN